MRISIVEDDTKKLSRGSGPHCGLMGHCTKMLNSIVFIGNSTGMRKIQAALGNLRV